MGFQPIDAKPKSKGSFQIRMTTRRGADRWFMLVSIPSARVPAMLPGDPSFVQAMLGDGDETGKLLLVPSTSGIKIAHMKFCAMIRLPEVAVFPCLPLETMEPEFQIVDWKEAVAGKALLFVLPEWANDGERAKAISAASQKNAEEERTKKAAASVPARGGSEPDFSAAPPYARQVWKLIVNNCLKASERSIRLSPKAVAEAAGIPGAAALNALAWLSINNIVARQPAGGGKPDILTPVIP